MGDRKKNNWQTNQRWETGAYHKILFRIPKDKCEELKCHADDYGESVNSFIAHAIYEFCGLDLRLTGTPYSVDRTGKQKEKETTDR